MIEMIDMIFAPQTFLAFGLPGGYEWMVLLVLGLLIFGRRLPEVGRSLGRGIIEFKKGIKGIEDEIEENSSEPGKLDQRSSPKLAEKTAPAVTTTTEPRTVTNAKVAGEGENPYAPQEEPHQGG